MVTVSQNQIHIKFFGRRYLSWNQFLQTAYEKSLFWQKTMEAEIYFCATKKLTHSCLFFLILIFYPHTSQTYKATQD